MTTEYHFPRILWDNLESILKAHSKKYVYELARYLKVPEKELYDKVFPNSDSVQIIIQDSHADINKCKAFVQRNKVTIYCKKPVAYHSEYCSFHRNCRMAVLPSEDSIKTIIQIKEIDKYESIWLINNTNEIINSKGDLVGKWNKSKNKIILYTF